MKCPVCKDATLTLIERQGVEIDYCPECRGVWLDRGEIDRLIERSQGPTGDRASGDFPDRGREPGRHKRRHRDDEYRGKPRKSFLRDFFD